MQPLCEGGVYFVWKPADSSDGRMKYIRGLQLALLDTSSSTRSLSVLLSAVETSLRTRKAQEIAQGGSAVIISTHVIQATAILFEGGRLELSTVRLLFEGGDYSGAASK